MRVWVCVASLIVAAGCAQRTMHTARRPSAVSTAMRRQVINAADAGDGDLMVNRLRQRIAADPSNVTWRLELASQYARNGVPELEIEHLRVAVERFPASRAAHLALAKVLRKAGYAQGAAESLSAFATAQPDPEILNELGICYDDAGDWKAGEQAFRKGIELEPRLDYLHNNLGYNLLRQERVAEAVAALELAVKWNPRSETARNNLGLALARSSGPQTAEALKHFENVTDSATANSNLGAVLIEQQRYAESRRSLVAALEYNRNHAAALANLALLSELDGKPAELPAKARVSPWRWPVIALKWIFVPPQPQASQEPVRTAKGESR